jgi:hypothetical protein
MDSAHHVIELYLIQQTRVQYALRDVASTVHQSLGCGEECEVHFRPVRGGNPPVCAECHQAPGRLASKFVRPGKGGY